MNPAQNVVHGQTFVLVASLGVLLLILELVRRRKIGERFSLLWILIAVGMCIASVGLPLLMRMAPLIGLVYPPSALFLLSFLGLTALSIYFTVLLSRLSHQLRVIAQRVALLESHIAHLPGSAQVWEQ